ncbi:MAG TPA: hypothetical protein VN541_22565 [Tepidisphaeraceae bacterium]|nr:hypothetical protein [Tepidisphaeraceae bacterium]
MTFLCLLPAHAWAGRYESFTKKAEAGSKMNLVASASFGEQGFYDFVSGGQLDDGTIVAFGNAWGPAFPRTPAPLVLGRGHHQALDPFLPGPKHKTPVLRSDDPDAAGVIVFYSADLAKVRKVVRFDWGVASLSAGIVLPGRQGLLIAGRCTPRFADAMRSRLHREPVPADTSTGPYEYGGVKLPGDVFVAMLPASGDGVLWAIVFEGARVPPQQLWLDYELNIYADIRGMVRIAPTGYRVTRIDTAIETSDGRSHSRNYTANRSAAYLCVDPREGSFYYGGDRPAYTGYEPWHQPYLYKFSSDGHRSDKLWDWPAKDVATGGDGIGLCADSTVTSMDVAPDGSLVIGGWSIGGNSVFFRQPQTLDRRVRLTGFGMETADERAGTSTGYLMRFDPKKHRVIDGTLFQAYIPADSTDKRHRGEPNSIRIRQVKTLPDGSVAFCGTAAAGLIQTPNAISFPIAKGQSQSGEFLAVFSPDFQTLLYSSYLPGIENEHVQAVADGLILTARYEQGPAQHDRGSARSSQGRMFWLRLPTR